MRQQPNRLPSEPANQTQHARDQPWPRIEVLVAARRRRRVPTRRSGTIALDVRHDQERDPGSAKQSVPRWARSPRREKQKNETQANRDQDYPQGEGNKAERERRPGYCPYGEVDPGGDSPRRDVCPTAQIRHHPRMMPDYAQARRAERQLRARCL
jgi:hypothetical protein